MKPKTEQRFKTNATARAEVFAICLAAVAENDTLQHLQPENQFQAALAMFASFYDGPDLSEVERCLGNISTAIEEKRV